MGSEKPDLGSGRPDLGSERPDLGSGRPDLRSEKPDLGSERSDLESKRPDLGSERLYLRLRGGGDGRTDGRKPEKIALCGIIGHRPLRGRCPKRTCNVPIVKGISLKIIYTRMLVQTKIIFFSINCT